MILVGLAFLGGATVQAMPPSSMAKIAAVAELMPGCSEMATSDAAHAPASPHKGITPDCVKLMQCLGIPDRAVQPSLAEGPVAYGPVNYWSTDRRLSGISNPPLPFPPRPA